MSYNLNSQSRAFLIFTFLIMMVVINTIKAQVPRTLSYQGQLCGVDGTPVDDGDYNIAFTLYPSVDGGTGLWEEVQLIATNSGIFSAVLGSVNPINISFNSPMWLGIKINNGEELSPRTALSSSAYSLGIAGDVSNEGLTFPNGFGSDPDYVGSEGNHLAFGHAGVSEDYIGYKANTFYIKDSPGGGDNTQPDLVVGGKIKSESGGFEFPDGTTQTSAATGSGGGGSNWTLSDNAIYNNNSGYVGIGQSFPTAQLHIGGTEGLIVEGAYGQGTEQNLGEGARMHWYPKKSAFRVGYSHGSQWDDASIGEYSIAMGYSTWATGRYSTAFGKDTKATHVYSTAMGFSSWSFGLAATAMGYCSQARGDYSVAIGRGAKASGETSVAIGYSTNAIGNWSTAFGYETIARGFNSTAVGRETEASGRESTALGVETTAIGIKSLAAGYSVTAQSYCSFAIGRYNISSGNSVQWVSSDPLFVVGNGSYSAPSNALTLYKNGDMEVSGSVTSREVIQSTGGGFKFPDGTTQTTAAAPGFPAPNYDSGWVDIAVNADITFDHSVGGNADNYFVDLSMKGITGITSNSHGGDYTITQSGTTLKQGVFYWDLTNELVSVHRNSNDSYASQIRIRIWAYN